MIVITLADFQVRIVMKEIGNKDKQHKIDLSGLSQGIYIVTFHFERGQITKKIIID